ncbi:hypothetical protein ACH4ND_01470 [Streptomyces sp. NPDC017179]|uniref:hypothetical protein n=1 Tax=Streptomyces sp. NPDC017179 TaxID=3364979 RepID=UPI0037BC82B1
MTRHRVEVRTDGRHGQVLIDGHDIARSVVGLTFTAGVREVPTLRLDLRLIDVTQLGSTEMEVLLGEGVAETLELLGWTAPATDGERQQASRQRPHGE